MKSQITRTFIAAIAAVSLGGCAGLSVPGLSGPELTRAGLYADQQEIRTLLAQGRPDSVLLTLEKNPGTTKDELLQKLYVGLASSYAGDYALSQRAFQEAYDLAEDRYTKSVSENLGALLTSDNAVGYLPGETERLFVHYYGICNFSEQKDPDGAAVEARRLVSLLERFEENQDSVDVKARAFMHYLAGTAFEASGDRNGASVAYRNAFALAGEDAFPAPLESAKGEGTVVVLLEHGFVDHKVPTPMKVALGESESNAFGSNNPAAQAATASLVAGLVASTLASEQGGGLYWGGPQSELSIGDLGQAAYVLSLAWPTFNKYQNVGVRGSVAGQELYVPVRVSDAIVGDFRRARPAMLTRMIGRSAVKMYATKKIEQKAGLLAGLAANLAAGLLEEADVRQWHLLPGELGISRVSLPEGTHEIEVEVIGPQGAPQKLAVGPVDVRAGETQIVRVRNWK